MARKYTNIHLVTLKNGSKRYRTSIKNSQTGRMQRLGTFRSLLEAQQAIHRAKADISMGKPLPYGQTALTLAITIEQYLQDLSWHKSYKYDKIISNRWIAEVGSIRLTALTPTHLKQIRTKWRETGMSPSRANRYLDWLRTLYTVKIKEGVTIYNPVLQVPRYPEPEAPTYFFSEAQETRLLEELGPYYGSWVRLAILTGLRRHNLFSLKKDQINWEEGIITIPETKNRRARYRPLTHESTRILHTLCQRHPDSPFVFPSPRFPHKPMDPQAWIRKVFKPACQKAGIPPMLSWHTLKHTTGSRLIKAGYSARQVQLALDHSSLRATERYTHMISTDMMTMMNSLSGYTLATLSKGPKTPHTQVIEKKRKKTRLA